MKFPRSTQPYVRMKRGFIYLTAIMDWFSRYVLSWEISITLETEFCLVALDRALGIAKPEIFNSDQGSQFTSVVSHIISPDLSHNKIPCFRGRFAY